MITFKKAMKLIPDGEKPSLLVANGFSQAWDARIFNYSSILSAASFGDRDKEIKKIFSLSNTYDFESVMDKLISAEMILENYNGDPDLISRIKADQETLKTALVTAIAKTHPSLPSEISDIQFSSVRKFLSNFHNIFSLNYDLLLYWAINKFDIPPEGYLVDDGFRSEQTWMSHGTEQNLFFLHGGLHIYESEARINKHVSKHDGTPIIEKVRTNLIKNKFPLFVSEPTSEKKKNKIEHNPYLYKAFSKFGELEGVLFIHGHSMDESDKHIFDQIVASKISKVYVSIFGDENSESNRRSKANAKAYIENKNISVEFYKADSVAIWA